MDTDIVLCFYPEDGGSMFLLNVSTHLPDYTLSLCRKPQILTYAKPPLRHECISKCPTPHPLRRYRRVWEPKEQKFVLLILVGERNSPGGRTQQLSRRWSPAKQIGPKDHQPLGKWFCFPDEMSQEIILHYTIKLSDVSQT
jgi:hypothetical protein